MLVLVTAATVALRWPLLSHQSLWVDEVFSLAMATGHSLEHPAAVAEPALGDYSEPPMAVPASHFQSLMRHEEPASGPGRVLRAVMLSDTSPPLYYLVLHAWTRVVGTSDAALRALSLLCTVACLPLVWSIGRRIGGRATARYACVLFSVVPVGVYFGTEGRMYAMVWFLALALARLTLQVRRRRPRHMAALGLWVLVAAAGLMTHYFFAFVVAAAAGWLAVWPRGRRKGEAPAWEAVALGAAALLLVLPWYIRLPEALGGWRVTNGWLLRPNSDTPWVLQAPRLAWSYLSCVGPWGGERRAEWVLIGIMSLVVILAAWRIRFAMFSRSRALLWLWLAAACVGPIVFDLLRGTHTATVHRYALPGLPAGILLLGLMLGHRAVPRLAGLSLLALIVVCWLVAARELYRNEYRLIGSPFTTIARHIAPDAHEGDVVLVHSIPSGVLGVARYLPPETKMISWVSQLEVRTVPEDLVSLLEGHRRVIVVQAHDLGGPAVQRLWLEENAKQVYPWMRHSGASITTFVPSSGEVFTPAE